MSLEKDEDENFFFFFFEGFADISTYEFKFKVFVHVSTYMTELIPVLLSSMYLVPF